MNQVFKTLPDDRPITCLNVVEDVENCPKGYIPISKTHDQDSDADLWKECGFFGRKCTRYLCISKTEGVQDYVIQSLCMISDKEAPPQGFKSVPKTYDSEQKAWRKKQLCYRLGHISSCDTAVTDIIVLGRMKKAPEEFTFLGEINGLTLCYKIGKVVIANNTSFYSKVPYPILPCLRGSANPTSPENISQNVLLRPSTGGTEDGTDMLRPFRPAPKPPTSIYATISGYNGLEGVPFILNPRLNFSNDANQPELFEHYSGDGEPTPRFGERRSSLESLRYNPPKKDDGRL